jgi:hypothetical protein
MSAPGPMADRDEQAAAIAKEFPGWEAWQSIKGGQWHARMIGSEPIVMVHDESPEGLCTQIRRAIAARPPKPAPPAAS